MTGELSGPQLRRVRNALHALHAANLAHSVAARYAGSGCNVMSRKRAFIIPLIALVVVLPLYELADYKEQYPHDSDLVLVLLTLFFLFGLTRICGTLIAFSLALLRRFTSVRFVANIERCRPFAGPRSPSILFLIFCDFRI